MENLIAKFIGGSHLYGLNTAESDIDYRGVYISDDVSYIIGLDKRKDVKHVAKMDGDDFTYYEFRRLLELLRKTNTAAIEFLFVPDEKLLVKKFPYDLLRANRDKLIDSSSLLSSTRGYVQGEKRLALGERTGRLGGARKEKLDTYGFSPKNVCQIIRIVIAAEHFLKTGNYPLNISAVDRLSFELALKIKTSPSDFTKEEVSGIIEEYESRIMNTEDKVELKFNNSLANDLLIAAYKKYLKL